MTLESAYAYFRDALNRWRLAVEKAQARYPDIVRNEQSMGGWMRSLAAFLREDWREKLMKSGAKAR
jgi:hypothetical protein